eukprot:8848316-Alexandrium_andersonii.AAC.1
MCCAPLLPNATSLRPGGLYRTMANHHVCLPLALRGCCEGDFYAPSPLAHARKGVPASTSSVL